MKITEPSYEQDADVVEEDIEYVSKRMEFYAKIPRSKGGKKEKKDQRRLNTSRKEEKDIMVSNKLSDENIKKITEPNLKNKQTKLAFLDPQNEDAIPKIGIIQSPFKEITPIAGIEPSRKISLTKDISFSDMNYDVEWCNGESGILVIDVIDTGPGMTPKETERLFKPFSQANSTIKSKYGGTGLGLWIAKQLIQQMSGCIEVHSVPSKGTRFRISLPLKIVRSDIPSSPKIYIENRAEGSGTLTSIAKLINGGQGADLRAAGRVKFIGNKEILKGMKILMIENDKMKNDLLIDQIITQVKKTDCEVTYSTYSSWQTTLEFNAYKTDAILLLTTIPITQTKEALILIKKILHEKGYTKIQLSLASGKA